MPNAGYQFEEMRNWIGEAIHYHLGVDGISLFLVLLTTFLTPIAILCSWESIQENVKGFFIAILVIETAMIGVFVSLDLFLFFVFWELTLIPMYFMIGMWGHDRRIYAAIKFILYTMFGSILMLVAILWLYNLTGTFDLQDIESKLQAGLIAIPPHTELLLFGAFFLAFAIKVPLFPLHTWLPDAHTEAPTAGSVILAGVMLKLGTYGILRFCLPLFPYAAHRMAPLIGVLAIIGIVYGALVATVQHDLKRLVAYTSVSHLGFVVLGLFAFSTISVQGADLSDAEPRHLHRRALPWRRHALRPPPHARNSEFGGLANPMPVLMGFFLFIALSSLALPPLNGFIGEFLILIGTFEHHHQWASWATSGAVLSAIYLLWSYQRVALGEVTVEKNDLTDANGRERLILVTMSVMIIFMGVASRCSRGACSLPRTICCADGPPAERCAAAGHNHRRALRSSCSRAAPGRAHSSPWPKGGATADVLRRRNCQTSTGLLPEVVLCIFGILIMLVDPFDRRRKRTCPGVARAYWRGFALISVHVVSRDPGLGLQQSDQFRRFQHLRAPHGDHRAADPGDSRLHQLPRPGRHSARRILRARFVRDGGNGHSCAGANELVTAFVGLEMSSISTYILAGFRRHATKSNEASLKYFLLGSFATAFFLYGIAMVYGATGTTQIDAIQSYLARPLRYAALAILGSGPDLRWTRVQSGRRAVPDLRSRCLRRRAHAGHCPARFGPEGRHFRHDAAHLRGRVRLSSNLWFWAIFVSAVLTMFIGNLAALVQTNVKRMLAYSSIAHAGYILVAFAASTAVGVAAVFFYLGAYVLMKVGAFLVVTHLGQQGEKRLEIRDYAGLAQQPVLAACFSLFLLSLLGLPATGGFLGKFFAFQAALDVRDPRFVWLVVIAAINSVIGAYYYLRVIIVMYFSEPSKDYVPRRLRRPSASRLPCRHRHPLSRYPARARPGSRQIRRRLTRPPLSLSPLQSLPRGVISSSCVGFLYTRRVPFRRFF